MAVMKVLKILIQFVAIIMEFLNGMPSIMCALISKIQVYYNFDIISGETILT